MESLFHKLLVKYWFKTWFKGLLLLKLSLSCINRVGIFTSWGSFINSLGHYHYIFLSYSYIYHMLYMICLIDVYQVSSSWLRIPCCQNYVYLSLILKLCFLCLWVPSRTYKTKQYPNLSLLNGLLDIFPLEQNQLRHSSYHF